MWRVIENDTIGVALMPLGQWRCSNSDKYIIYTVIHCLDDFITNIKNMADCLQAQLCKGFAK